MARLKRELARVKKDRNFFDSSGDVLCKGIILGYQVTDITEIKTQQGKPHLCIVLDLYEQCIVGWVMHARQDLQMVIRAVQMGDVSG